MYSAIGQLYLNKSGRKRKKKKKEWALQSKMAAYLYLVSQPLLVAHDGCGMMGVFLL